jgi:hypothetical protein
MIRARQATVAVNRDHENSRVANCSKVRRRKKLSARETAGRPTGCLQRHPDMAHTTVIRQFVVGAYVLFPTVTFEATVHNDYDP